MHTHETFPLSYRTESLMKTFLKTPILLLSFCFQAVSRRATLHEMIRDYDQAASDLQRLISILVKQNGEKAKTSGTSSGDRSSIRKELKQARQRLSVMEEKSKEGIALDFFLIMYALTIFSIYSCSSKYNCMLVDSHALSLSFSRFADLQGSKGI